MPVERNRASSGALYVGMTCDEAHPQDSIASQGDLVNVSTGRSKSATCQTVSVRHGRRGSQGLYSNLCNRKIGVLCFDVQQRLDNLPLFKRPGHVLGQAVRR